MFDSRERDEGGCLSHPLCLRCPRQCIRRCSFLWEYIGGGCRCDTHSEGVPMSDRGSEVYLHVEAPKLRKCLELCPVVHGNRLEHLAETCLSIFRFQMGDGFFDAGARALRDADCDVVVRHLFHSGKYGRTRTLFVIRLRCRLPSVRFPCLRPQWQDALLCCALLGAYSCGFACPCTFV